MKPEPVPEVVHSLKQSGFKKKSNNNIPSGETDYFKGKDRLKIYERTIDRLALYTSTQFKNGRNIVVFLCQKSTLRQRYQSCQKFQPTTISEYGSTLWETT